MTHEEWMNKTDDEYKKLAREIAQQITYRTWIDGSSHDSTVKANNFEREMTYGIIMAAFLTYGRRTNADLQSIIDTAEFAGHFLYNEQFTGTFTDTNEEVNCYDTIYIPLQKVMGEWS